MTTLLNLLKNTLVMIEVHGEKNLEMLLACIQLTGQLIKEAEKNDQDPAE